MEFFKEITLRQYQNPPMSINLAKGVQTITDKNFKRLK